LKILIASSSTLAIPLFKAITSSSDHQICGLLTNVDKPTGRGQKKESNQLAVWALAEKYIVYKSDNDAEINAALKQTQADLVITIAFGQLVKEEALQIPKYGWINIHFSELPKWRGAAPVQHAILNSEKIIGISIFKLNKGMDTGPIYLSKNFPLGDHESTPEVLNRLSAVGADLVLQVIGMIKEHKQPIIQSDNQVSYAPKFHKNDCSVQWGATAVAIYNFYRALGANPGIWTMLSETRLKINSLKISTLDMDLQPGEICIVQEQIFVGTSDGIIEILNLTPAGRSPMTAAEFVRGLTTKSGLRFG
jgi:methionyl-tRNA formyltransferase